MKNLKSIRNIYAWALGLHIAVVGIVIIGLVIFFSSSGSFESSTSYVENDDAMSFGSFILIIALIVAIPSIAIIVIEIIGIFKSNQVENGRNTEYLILSICTLLLFQFIGAIIMLAISCGDIKTMERAGTTK